MKNRLITGILFIILGALIAIGPQTIFPVCGVQAEEGGAALEQAQTGGQDPTPADSAPAETAPMVMTMAPGSVMTCHWTAQAEIGVGGLIALLGALLIIFRTAQIRLGISLGIASGGILALLVPTVLIGVCGNVHMVCHSLALPALSILSGIVIAGSSANALYLYFTGRKEQDAGGKRDTLGKEGQASA